jgi:branched-chain amino acid transport system substrate-binding protein
MRMSVLAVAMIAGALATAVCRAADPYDIQVILPLTGSGAFMGLTQQQGLQVAEKIINAECGIDGRPVRFVIHDDETNPQVSVQIASRLREGHPPVILGPSLSANCRRPGGREGRRPRRRAAGCMKTLVVLCV